MEILLQTVRTAFVVVILSFLLNQPTLDRCVASGAMSPAMADEVWEEWQLAGDAGALGDRATGLRERSPDCVFGWALEIQGHLDRGRAGEASTASRQAGRHFGGGAVWDAVDALLEAHAGRPEALRRLRVSAATPFEVHLLRVQVLAPSKRRQALLDS